MSQILSALFVSKAGLHNEVVSIRSKSPSGNNSWEKSTANRRAYFSHALISIKINGQKLFLSPVTNPEPKHLLCFTVSLMLLKLHMLQSRFCPWGHWETKSPVNKKGNNLFTLTEMGWGISPFTYKRRHMSKRQRETTTNFTSSVCLSIRKDSYILKKFFRLLRLLYATADQKP